MCIYLLGKWNHYRYYSETERRVLLQQKFQIIINAILQIFQAVSIFIKTRFINIIIPKYLLAKHCLEDNIHIQKFVRVWNFLQRVSSKYIQILVKNYPLSFLHIFMSIPMKYFNYVQTSFGYDNPYKIPIQLLFQIFTTEIIWNILVISNIQQNRFYCRINSELFATLSACIS